MSISTTLNEKQLKSFNPFTHNLKKISSQQWHIFKQKDKNKYINWRITLNSRQILWSDRMNLYSSLRMWRSVQFRSGTHLNTNQSGRSGNGWAMPWENIITVLLLTVTIGKPWNGILKAHRKEDTPNDTWWGDVQPEELGPHLNHTLKAGPGWNKMEKGNHWWLVLQKKLRA